jgi:hypothetical protein
VCSQTARDYGQTAYGARARSAICFPPPSIPLHLPTHEKHFILLSLSLSRRRGPLLGKALPFDPGSTKGIPGLTVMSSSIPSRYFIVSSPPPWISLPRVHKVKDEDLILDHGFIGLMLGIVPLCQYESLFKVWLVDLLGKCLNQMGIS